jgi:hypothetical protein
MLVNVVEGAEAAGACLAHVYCMEGGKWYGQVGGWVAGWGGGGAGARSFCACPSSLHLPSIMVVVWPSPRKN